MIIIKMSDGEGRKIVRVREWGKEMENWENYKFYRS